MDAAELDRKVLRALAFKGRACTVDEIQKSWGLDNQDVEASLARLSTRRLIARPPADGTKWVADDVKPDPVREVSVRG